ncbi:hypothetical protein WJ23_03935 [Burkholderia lata]|nr:hypothetical protein WJ23_03935 [Burkholderia lata]
MAAHHFGSRICVDAVCAKLLGERFSPLMQISFAWIEPPAVRATGVNTHMYVGMCLVIVFREYIRASVTESFVCKCPCRLPYRLAVGTRGHRQQHVERLSTFAFLGDAPSANMPLLD